MVLRTRGRGFGDDRGGVVPDEIRRRRTFLGAGGIRLCARSRSDDTGSFTETTDVTVDGQVMSCRLTGLDAETSYLIYAYVDMGSGGRMQSKPVVVQNGGEPRAAPTTRSSGCRSIRR